MELTHFKVITCNTAKLENAEVDTCHMKLSCMCVSLYVILLVSLAQMKLSDKTCFYTISVICT